jgi:hypothetical protein
MKTSLPPLFKWLAIAAVVEWLLGRTLARAAIFMPKTAVMVAGYQGLGVIGQVAVSLASLLALAGLGWMAWEGWKMRGGLALALVCAGLMATSVAGLFVPAAGGLGLAFQVLMCAGIGLLVWRAWRLPLRIASKVAITLAGLALLLGRLYQSLDAIYAALHLPGPPAASGLLFNLGELLVLASVAALWWAYGRGASWKTWLAGLIPAALFTLPRLLAPAMTGIMTIWSTGLTLYLPWPAYGMALWLASVTVIQSLRRGEAAGWAVLLLAAGGYAAQMSSQAFLGLIALWVLMRAEGLDAGVEVQVKRHGWRTFLPGNAHQPIQRESRRL